MQSTVEQVTQTSTTLANGLSAAYVSIDNDEDLCIQTVLDKVKADTDALTSALQNCLMNGFDEPQPESSSSSSSSTSTTSAEPSESTSEEPQPETSEEPQPESSEGPQPEESSSASVSTESSSSTSSQSFEIPDNNQMPEEQP